MFGKILKIEDKIVQVENLKKVIQANVINFHVVFEESGETGGNALKIVGEILGMNEKNHSFSLSLYSLRTKKKNQLRYFQKTYNPVNQ